MISFPAEDIWKAKAEPKCKFFAWLVMHDKALTMDNMAKKNLHHNPFCALCFCQNETTAHILTECNYTEAFWRKIANNICYPSLITLLPLKVRWNGLGSSCQHPTTVRKGERLAASSRSGGTFGKKGREESLMVLKNRSRSLLPSSKMALLLSPSLVLS
jgi:hypothetical protein